MPRLVALSVVVACGTSGPDPRVDDTGDRAPDTPLAPPYDVVAATSCDAPEPPRIQRDLARVGEDTTFSSPQIPPNRTTADGRLAINVQGGGPAFRLWLFAPEKLDEPVLGGPAGRSIVADLDGWTVPFDPEPHDMTGHHVICDPTMPFEQPGERPNPYACGDEGDRDCYDVTVLTNTVKDGTVTFWGVPLHAEVANPKTAEAQLVAVETGEPVRGASVPLSPEWSESAVTQDGRLLTGRVGSIPRAWTNPVTGETRIEGYDLMYSVLPPDAEPCDVTGFTDFHPMSHAPFDPAMRGTYGLAAHPFRDSEGTPIADGDDLKGTYPWVDRFGRNVFMSAVPDTFEDVPEDAYPRRCAEGDGCEGFVEARGLQKGYLVAGAWTHGRFVHLDGLINHTDWPLGMAPKNHLMVELYAEGPHGIGPTEVRVGLGRVGADEGAPLPRGFGGNANIFDSIEHVFTWSPHLRPGTPRDVVWLLNTGVASDEIAFDDFLDPDAFLVSEMQGTITPAPAPIGPKVRYWNGFERTLGGDMGFTGEVHIQNAATALPDRWAVPSYGLLEPGEARLEPVAMGGIRGKGLWLDGAADVVYDVPPQPTPQTAPGAYVGVFVDLRRFESSLRTVLAFPDGSRLQVQAPDALLLSRGDDSVHVATLPEPFDHGWTHLGLQLAPGHTTLTVLHDGYALETVELDRPLFTITEGPIRLGRDPRTEDAGMCGWVDELKVLLHPVGPEVACNHAHGTLIGVEEGSPWFTRAAAYDPAAHADLAARVAAAGEGASTRYACLHDHETDARVLHAIPPDVVGVREAVIFPEGPLRADAPRPDSMDNAFCTSCHHDAAAVPGLGLGALTRVADRPAEDDPRRQPMQPPRRVFGVIPDGWLGAPGGDAGDDGLLVDRYLLAD